MTNQRSFSLIRRHTTVRLTTDAVLIAVYVALASFVSINLPIAQFSLSSLPILLCVFALGVPDAVAVALCGSFIEQVLYGLSPTAPLWMAAPRWWFAPASCRKLP